MHLNKTRSFVAGSLLSLAAGASQAAIDLTDVTAAGVDIALVGAAVFAVVVGIMVFKWIRRAL
jgi:hypothetical protein